jgi:hypothetical protein
LKGCRLAARDGEIGHLKDLLFDDRAWTVRFLVADTGNWLPHRKVLLPPSTVVDFRDVPPKSIAVTLTKQQIEESPPLETHSPVSRKFEAESFDYFGCPYYWPGPLLWGPVETPAAFFPPQPRLSESSETGQPDSPSLRSANEMGGFHGFSLQALDQAFGHVEQFILDDASWAIRYLVVDVNNWLPGKRVLLSPQWIAWVGWAETRVYIDLDRSTVQRAPTYDPQTPITREYEEALFSHYTRRPYWEPPVEESAARTPA